jgi:hypothetical protein
MYLPKISTPILAFIFILVGFNLEPSITNSKKLTAIAQSAPQSNQPQQALFPIAINDKAGKQKWGFIDRTGKVVIQPQFDSIRLEDTTEGLVAVKLDKKLGFVDLVNRVMILPQFDNLHGFSNNLALVKVDSKWGYIDRTGKMIIQPQFDGGGNFKGDLAPVQVDTKLGYIDRTGKMIIQPQFDMTYGFDGGDLAPVQINKKWGYIDRLGKMIVQPKFDQALELQNGCAKVELNKKWGCIVGVSTDPNHSLGELITNPRFDAILPTLSGGSSRVAVNKKWGYIDRTGKVVIEPQFDDVSDENIHQRKGLIPV